MGKTKLQKAYDALSPDAEAKSRMLDNILAGAEAQKHNVTPRHFRLRRAVSLAAAAALVMAIGVTAYATDWFGLKETMIGPQEIDTGWGETETVDIISLQGYANSPEYQATKEWAEFVSSYDQDGSILSKIGNSTTGFEEKYGFYLCYTQEMADKIDEICEKYSLSLLNQIFLPQTSEELFSMAGTGEIWREQSQLYENSCYTPYVCDDGSFKFDGEARLTGAGTTWPYLICYEFTRCVKGSFNPVVLNIGDLDSYEQWNYTTQNGTALALAQSDWKELIIAELDDSFVVINILEPYICDVNQGELHKSKADLEAFAEIFDFSVIP